MPKKETVGEQINKGVRCPICTLSNDMQENLYLWDGVCLIKNCPNPIPIKFIKENKNEQQKSNNA